MINIRFYESYGEREFIGHALNLCIIPAYDEVISFQSKLYRVSGIGVIDYSCKNVDVFLDCIDVYK